MSLQELIQTYGAKAANLDYISRELPDLPIQPYVMVAVGEDWRERKEEIIGKKLDLVRSSSPLEDRRNISFAGLFRSEKMFFDMVNDKWIDSMMNDTIQKVFGSANSEDTLLYAENHGIIGPIPIALLFQRQSTSEHNCSILRHPHQNDLLIIASRSLDNENDKRNVIYNEKTGQCIEIKEYCNNIIENKDPFFGAEDPLIYFYSGIQAYQEIEKLSEFQDEYTYQMEFGVRPFSVYQFRPFRKKEVANWSLEEKIPSIVSSLNEEIKTRKMGLTFGITPKEGLELNYGLLLGRKPTYEHNFEKEDSCIFGDIRNNTEFDLLYPKPHAVVATAGYEFLTHEMFRSAQHYNVFMIGHYLLCKENIKCRIYSDGVIGFAMQT